MPTTLSPTDICNIALSKIGAVPIQSITDLTSPSAIACNTNFLLCYLEVSRSGRWSCLLDTSVLTQETQDPLPGAPSTSSYPTWEPLTFYAANTFLTYGGYVYQVMYDYTSTVSFVNDLTTGALTQQNTPTTGNVFGFSDGSGYPSGWAYKYALPGDCQFVASLNDNVYWDFFNAGGNEYEIMGLSIFCDWSQAVIQYVKNQPDCTRWDSLFTSAVAYKLAAMISTPLRQDGGKMEAGMEQGYQFALAKARQKNGGELKTRRFNPIGSSLFLGSRYGGSNG